MHADAVPFGPGHRNAEKPKTCPSGNRRAL